MDAKRGFLPEDERNFAPEAIEKLKTASRHISYLVNEGYDLKQASVFVGNHFLLSERQRLAITRSVAAGQQLAERSRKKAELHDLAGKEVWIDGFNTVITLEVLLSDSLLFLCMDETVRDLASLRGTYRLIPETAQAVRLMLDVLRQAGVKKANILLDKPVSNSGRLKVLIAETGYYLNKIGILTYEDGRFTESLAEAGTYKGSDPEVAKMVAGISAEIEDALKEKV